MKLKSAIAVLGTAASVCLARPASAVPTFAGSYQVGDGPYWGTNPPVYSGREAAALIFGGLPADYLISIDAGQDWSSITQTAWYDGWGEHQGMIFNQDYKLDVGNPGYNDPGGLDTARSAYVGDGLFGGRFTNYVWTNDLPRNNDNSVPVTPEPCSLALLGVGLPLLGLRRRR